MKTSQTLKRNYCIQTLTHDHPSAGDLLRLTVETLIKNTDIEDENNSKLDWFIRVNGVNKHLQLTLDFLIEEYSDIINWCIHVGENIGVGAGINFLNSLSKEYEYVLFIEGDWMAIDEVNPKWLYEAIQLLDKNKDVDQVFLRRYLDDVEDRINGMQEWINKDSFKEKITRNNSTFVLLEKGVYTNNPVLRRQQSLFNKNIFPLKEFYDKKGKPAELKGNPDWGQAELQATHTHLRSFYEWPGIFKHEGNPLPDLSKLPCKTCKYGFMSTSEWFCLSCSTKDEFYNLSEHTSRGIQTLLDPIHHKKLDLQDLETVTKYVKKVVESPTVPTEQLVQKYYGKN